MIVPFHNYHNQGLYFTLTPESVTQSYFDGKKQEIAFFFPHEQNKLGFWSRLGVTLVTQSGR